MTDNIKINYYLNNEDFAVRYSTHVPRQGDEVRVNGVCYVVDLVVWYEDEASSRVGIRLVVSEGQ